MSLGTPIWVVTGELAAAGIAASEDHRPGEERQRQENHENDHGDEEENLATPAVAADTPEKPKNPAINDTTTRTSSSLGYYTPVDVTGQPCFLPGSPSLSSIAESMLKGDADTAGMIRESTRQVLATVLPGQKKR